MQYLLLPRHRPQLLHVRPGVRGVPCLVKKVYLQRESGRRCVNLPGIAAARCSGREWANLFERRPTFEAGVLSSFSVGPQMFVSLSSNWE